MTTLLLHCGLERSYYKALRFAAWTLALVALMCLTIGLISCKNRSPELQSDSVGTVDKPLTNFAQEITSATHELSLSPGGVFEVPVTIKNPTSDGWSSVGRYPVTVSYKWFDNGMMLPIEGDRTGLPTNVPPGGSVTLTVKGTVPQTGQKLLLKITLVQEGVAWFMIKGAPALELPVELKH